jgi:hypothetical protein
LSSSSIREGLPNRIEVFGHRVCHNQNPFRSFPMAALIAIRTGSLYFRGWPSSQ